MVRERSRPSSRLSFHRQWSLGLCLWLSCTPSGTQAPQAWVPQGAATVVGRSGESKTGVLTGLLEAAEHSWDEEREQAVAELSERKEEGQLKALVNPTGALLGEAPLSSAQLESPTALGEESKSLAVTQPDPPVPAVQLETAQDSSALGFMVGLRSEAELIKRGITPSLVAELSHGSSARLPDVRLGAALTLLIRPMGVRAEGRIYPYDVDSLGAWRIRPYLALGSTYVLSSGGLGGRGGVGAALQVGRLQLFADVAYEKFFTSQGIYRYEPRAVLISLGAGWSTSRRR